MDGDACRRGEAAGKMQVGVLAINMTIQEFAPILVGFKVEKK
jgi:hypothetical protein